MVADGLTAAAVLFDSDGVLVDSHAAVADAWRRVGAEFGLGGDLDVVGRRPVEVFRAHLAPDVVAVAVARLESIELHLAAGTRALPGARELMVRLPADRYAVVTSASRPLALARWEAAGLPIPAVAVTADDVRRGKPQPEPYRVAAELLDVDPADCVAFEDSPSGGRSARDAGATVVAVGAQPWDFAPALRIPDLGAAPVIRLDR